MNDREQLEYAAKAAGYIPVRLTDDGTALLLEGIQQPWNPRDENVHSDCMGDALRLAVKLHLWVGQHDDGVTVSDLYARFSGSLEEDYGNDPCAANRLAIVRAAAEIGKAMP